MSTNVYAEIRNLSYEEKQSILRDFEGYDIDKSSISNLSLKKISEENTNFKNISNYEQYYKENLNFLQKFFVAICSKFIGKSRNELILGYLIKEIYNKLPNFVKPLIDLRNNSIHSDVLKPFYSLAEIKKEIEYFFEDLEIDDVFIGSLYSFYDYNEYSEILKNLDVAQKNRKVFIDEVPISLIRSNGIKSIYNYFSDNSRNFLSSQISILLTLKKIKNTDFESDLMDLKSKANFENYIDFKVFYDFLVDLYSYFINFTNEMDNITIYNMVMLKMPVAEVPVAKDVSDAIEKHKNIYKNIISMIDSIDKKLSLYSLICVITREHKIKIDPYDTHVDFSKKILSFVLINSKIEHFKLFYDVEIEKIKDFSANNLKNAEVSRAFLLEDFLNSYYYQEPFLNSPLTLTLINSFFNSEVYDDFNSLINITFKYGQFVSKNVLDNAKNNLVYFDRLKENFNSFYYEFVSTGSYYAAVKENLENRNDKTKNASYEMLVGKVRNKEKDMISEFLLYLNEFNFFLDGIYLNVNPDVFFAVKGHNKIKIITEDISYKIKLNQTIRLFPILIHTTKEVSNRKLVIK